jgi:phage terminase large subunit
MKQITLPYTPRRWAEPFHASTSRFLAMILHRRAGKTTAIINHHQRAALDDGWEERRLRALVPALTASQIAELLHPPGGRHYAHIMPLRNQAKVTIWDALKFHAQAVPGVEFNEAELLVRYPTGHKLQLFGADNPDALRGPGFSGLSFDEYSQHPRNLFSEILSKSLADHLGYAIFAGTIRGKDQLFQMYQAGKGRPDWFTLWQDADVSLATEDDATITLLRQAMADDRSLIAKGLMSQAEYDQEWFLSPEAAIQGAFFGAEMAAVSKGGRICNVPYDPALLVDTDWDLGIDDSTVIWFSQSTRSGEVRIIDYYEVRDEGLPHYVQVLQDRGYLYGHHWGPHDIRVRDFGTGKSRIVAARALGLTFDVVPDLSFADGISAVRMILPRVWFDGTKCAPGIESLRQYRRQFNARMGEFTGTAVHDGHSHAADAFRGLAVRHKTPEAPKPVVEEYTYQFPSEYSWMGI